MLRARSFSSAALARPLPPANDGGPLVPLSAPLPAVRFLPPRLAVVVPHIARRKWSLRWVSFVALVVVPVLAAAVYYFAFAADHYVSEFRLSVHKSEAANPMPAWLLDTGGAPGVASLNRITGAIHNQPGDRRRSRPEHRAASGLRCSGSGLVGAAAVARLGRADWSNTGAARSMHSTSRPTAPSPSGCAHSPPTRHSSWRRRSSAPPSGWSTNCRRAPGTTRCASRRGRSPRPRSG